MHVATLTLYLDLPGNGTLKDKRSVVKGLLARLHKEFNVSAAEVGAHNTWNIAVLACALVTTDPAQGQRMLEKLVQWLERHRPDLELDDYRIEIR